MELSKVNPDFNDIVNQLSTELQSRSSWKDNLDSSTGETLIQFMAAITSYLYSEITRAVDETNIGTARNLSSVYALAHLLGVPIRRAVGGEVTVAFALESAPASPINFSKYDSFSIDGIPFFITAPLTIPTGVQLVTGIKLRQGTVNIHNFVSSGAPFQQFIVGSNYTTDDKYFDVQVNNDPVFWTYLTDTMWKFNPSAKVYQVTAMPDGAVRVLFGDGSTGQVPSSGVPIKIYEVSTLGKASNNSVSGLVVTPDTQPSVQMIGTTTSSISGGDDQESIDKLRFTIPRIFAAANRAVTRSDWTAVGIKYPGVADVKVWGEFEEGLSLALMNVVKVCLLMNTGPATAAEQDAFDTYVSDYKVLNTRVVYQTALAILLYVNVKVYVKIGFSLVQIQSNVRSAIEKYFTPQQGLIGRSLYISDLNNVILSEEGVDYVEFQDLVKATNLSAVRSPATPLIMGSPGIVAGTPSTSGGALADATYHYKVSAINLAGDESAASPNTSAVVSGGGGSGSVGLTWTAVTNADSYRIYRGTTSSNHSVYFTSATNSFTDVGGSSTAGTPRIGTLAAATYYAVITAMNGTQETGTSPEVSRAVPAAAGGINLSWTAVPGATSYRIYIGTAAAGENKQFETTEVFFYYNGTGGLTVNAPSRGLIVDATYYYVIVPVDSNNQEISKSSEINITIAQVGALNSIALTWTGIPEAASYNVYRGTFTGGQNVRYSGITTTSFTDMGNTGVIASPPVIVPILKDPILLQRYNFIKLQPTPIVTTISSGR